MWKIELLLFRWLKKRNDACLRKWEWARDNIASARRDKAICQREIDDRRTDSYLVRKSMEIYDDEIKRYTLLSGQLAKRFDF